MKFKKFISLVLCGTMFLSFTACGGNSGNSTGDAGSSDSASDSGDSGDSAEVAEVAPGKKGTLEYWTVFTGADGTSMQAMVDAYNATNPDYTINHRAIEANDLYLKLPLAVQSKQDVPDISIIHIERMPVFQENGFLTNYNDLLADSEIKAENYIDKAWKMSELDGGHYGIPLDVHTFATYVNMDLYEKYGDGELDDDILTYDEVKKISERSIVDDIYGTAVTWDRACFLGTYGQQGGTLSENGTDPSFVNDKAKKVFDLWTELYDAGYTPKEGDTPWEMFLGGKIVVCPEGIWMYNNVKEAELNANMYEFIALSETERGGWTSSHQFVLPTDDTRTPEETKGALDFINWIGNNSIEWAKAGQVPAHKSITENPEFNEMPQAFLATTDNKNLLMYDYKYYGYAVESLDKTFSEIRFGRMDSEEGLKQAEQETKDRISTEG